MSLSKTLQRLVAGEDLSTDQAAAAMHEVLTGNISPSLLAAFLIALRMKGETVDELVGFVRQMRVHAVHIHSRHPVLLDTCGTGGDGLRTFNISTLASLLIAACDVPVAKHGNRSVSSACGSADLLETLGVNISMPALATQRCLEKIGYAFLFAPAFHPALKKVAAVRKELGVRTVFHALGPLCNPAGANCRLLGVSDPGLVAKVVQVLKRLKVKSALVVSGADGMDEVSLAADTQVFRLRAGKISRFLFRPESVGMKRVKPQALVGGDANENAAIARAVLRGQRGPKRNAVVLNAAFGLMAADAVKNIRQGIRMAECALDSGVAQNKLNQLVQATQR